MPPTEDAARTPPALPAPPPAGQEGFVLPKWAHRTVVWGAGLFGALNVAVSSVSIGLLAYNHLHLGAFRSAALALSLDSGAAVAATLWVAAPRKSALRAWGCAVTLGLVFASMVGNASDFGASAAAVQPLPGALLTRDQLIWLALALVVLAPVVAMLLGHLVLLVKTEAARAREAQVGTEAGRAPRTVAEAVALSRPEARPEAQPALASEAQAALAPEAWGEARAEAASEASLALASEAHGEARPEARPEARSEAQAEAQPAPAPEASPDPNGPPLPLPPPGAPDPARLEHLQRWTVLLGDVPKREAVKRAYRVGSPKADDLRGQVAVPRALRRVQ